MIPAATCREVMIEQVSMKAAGQKNAGHPKTRFFRSGAVSEKTCRFRSFRYGS